MKRGSTQSSAGRLLSGLFLALLCLSLLAVTPAAAGKPAAAKPAAGTPSAGIPAQSFQNFFDEFVPQQMAAEHIVGATVAVVQDGALVFAQGYGMADLAAGTPVQAGRTLFYIGSDGKLFTWTAVMQLAEQGRLDLHADVNEYLDFELPAAFAEPVTLHHLMTHSAGFEDDYSSLFLDGEEQALPLREHLLRHMPQRVYAPGAVSAYSNYGTALAGYIVERVSGQPFETYLAEHLLQPLGMAHSVVGNYPPAGLAADISKGYKFQDGAYNAVDFEWTAAIPCAPLRTTATDLSRFMLAHLNGGCVDGACILKPETVALMHSPQFTHHPRMRGMAYGFLDMNFNGQRVLWHSGVSPRFTTVLALVPEHNLGLMVSFNSPPSNERLVLTGFMDAFFPFQPAPLEPAPVPGWEERAARFNGTYAPARSAQTSSQVLVRYRDSFPVRISQGSVGFNGWSFFETEAGVYRQVDGERVLAFVERADGQRWMFIGPLAYVQVAWYETPGFLLLVVGGCLLLFLSAWLAWPLSGLRRRSGSARPAGGALWLAGGLGVFDFGLLAWFATLFLSLADRFVFHQETALLIGGLYWLAVPWTLGVLLLAGRAWQRREWALGWRIHYTLVAGAAAGCLWLVWQLNLLGGV